MVKPWRSPIPHSQSRNEKHDPDATGMLEAAAELRVLIDQADWLYRTIQSRLTPDERERLPGAIHLLKRLLEP